MLWSIGNDDEVIWDNGTDNSVDLSPGEVTNLNRNGLPASDEGRVRVKYFCLDL